jgi:hypothetical protein
LDLKNRFCIVVCSAEIDAVDLIKSAAHGMPSIMYRLPKS